MQKKTKLKTPKTEHEAQASRIQELERDNEKLKLELRRYGRKPSKISGYLLLSTGLLSLLIVLFYPSVSFTEILTFIGLGLTLWGSLLLYIRPTGYVKVNLLESSVIPSLIAINQLIKELEINGKGVYLPPRYLRQLKTEKVFIPKRNETIIPSINELTAGRTFSQNPEGIFLTPPGLGLTNLYEEKIGKEFISTDINYLQKEMPKLFIEDLEIAKNLELNIDGDKVKAKIEDTIFKDLSLKCKELTNLYTSLGCPLTSSIALAIARATGKNIIIENNEISADGKNIEVSFRLLGEAKSEETPKTVKVKELKPSLPATLAGPILILMGASVLVWVSWLTWQDTIVWGKDLSLIFFGSRTGEAISLGIGMKVIYYFLIGLLLSILGLITSLRRGK